MTYEDLTAIMRSYNQSVAPGSESEAWSAYVRDIELAVGYPPWSDNLLEETVPDSTRQYWLSTAGGSNPDFDSATGDVVRS